MGDNSNTRGRTAATRPLDHKPGLRPIGSGLIRADGPTGRSALARAIHAGTAVKLAPAVAIGIEEWRAADWPERRRLRCLAHAHAHPALVLTGVSAARVLGLAILVDPDRETDEPVHLAHVGRGKTKNGSGHVVRSLCLEESDITIVDGVRTTTAARTIHDLRETHGPEHALAAVLQQVYIVGPDGRPIRRVDFWIPALAMVIEFHGWKKYDGRYGDGDVISTYENAAMRELANCGIDVVQLTWRMLVDGSAGPLIMQRVVARREFLEKAGPQFTGEVFLRHEKLPDRVTRFFRRD